MATSPDGPLPSAAEIIARLELKPHPEGGHYRETFRDIRVDADGRSRSTAIYFLLGLYALLITTDDSPARTSLIDDYLVRTLRSMG